MRTLLVQISRFLRDRTLIASLVVSLAAGLLLLAIEYGWFQRDRSEVDEQRVSGARHRGFEVVQRFYSLVSEARCEEAAQLATFPLWGDGVEISVEEWPKDYCNDLMDIMAAASRSFNLPRGKLYLYSEYQIGESYLRQQDPECRPFEFLREELFSGHTSLQDIFVVEYLLAPGKDFKLPGQGRWNINTAFVRLNGRKLEIFGLMDSWLHEWTSRKCL